MRRRTFFTTAALAALAGCTSSEDETEDVETPTDDETETDSGEGSEDTETETETEETTEESGGEAAIEIVEHELVVNEKDYTTDVYVAATVENTGDAASGMITLTADWYDDSGNYLDNDEWHLQTLAPGETWAARVYYLGGDGEQIADYEFDGEFQTSPPPAPEGLEVASSELQVAEDEAVVRGEVENTRDDTVDYVEAVGKIYDSDGVVLDDAWTNVTDLPAGETWSFEVSWRGRDRTSEAADHTTIIRE